MATSEREAKQEVILKDVSVIRVGARQTELLPQLAEIYYQTWHAEGLCENVAEAFTKMADFNPEDTYVVIGADSKVYALIQTLPVLLPSLAHLPHAYLTYASVEETCAAHRRSSNPNFLICFSINVLPGYRAQTVNGSVSLARHLLTNLPVPPGANKVAYSRFSQVEQGDTILTHYQQNLRNQKRRGPAWMHEGLGGLTAAIVNEARPEDVHGGGGNVIVVYPKNDAEKDIFEAVRSERLLHPPLTHTQGNIILFADVPI